MHIENPKFIESLHLALFSAADDGMHLEAMECDRESKETNVNPILSFRESESKILQLVIHGQDCDLIIPVSEIKRAIDRAENEVHSESFYDRP